MNAPDGGATAWSAASDGTIRGPWPETSSEEVPAVDWMPPGLPAANFDPITGLGSNDCPQGWRFSGMACAPTPGTCADGALPLPGARCTATTTSTCVDDSSANGYGIPTGVAPRWVLAGAPETGADGSFERPFATLAAALRDAPDGAWVLLRNGALQGPVTVARSVHLVGPCAARVTLRADATAPAVLTLAAGAQVELRSVTVRGGIAGVVLGEGASLSASNLALNGSTHYGIRATSPRSTLSLSASVVTSIGRGGTMLPADSAAVSLSGGHADITRCHFSDLGVPALRATGAASATVIDSLAQSLSDLGFVFETGSVGELQRVAIDRATYAALSVDVGARIQATDVAVKDTIPGPSGFTRGIFVAGDFTATRLSVTNPRMSGLFVTGSAAIARLDRATFVGGASMRCHGTSVGLECSSNLALWPQDGFLLSRTIFVTNGGALSAQRVALTDGEGNALFIENGTARLDGLRVQRYRGQIQGAGLHGYAAVAVNGTIPRNGMTPLQVPSALTLGGSLLADNEIHALIVYGERAVASVSNSVIRDHHAPNWESALATGYGAVVDGSGSLSLSGVRLERNELCAACSLGHGMLIVRRSLLASTHAGPGSGGGEGIHAQEGDARVTESVITSNQRAGIDAFGSHVLVDRSVVRGTEPHPEAVIATLQDRPALISRAGVGVFAETNPTITSRAVIEVQRSRVTANRGLGVGAVGARAAVHLWRSIVHDNEGPPGLPARGVDVSAGGRLDADSTLIAENQQVGVNVNGAGSQVFLRDSAIRSTLPDARYVAGFGLQATEGGRADLDRVLITTSTRAGLSVNGAGASASLRDVIISDVRPATVLARPSQGFGVYVARGASLTAERLAVASVHGAAVVSAYDTAPAAVDVRDLFVRDVQPAQVRTQEPLGSPVAYGLHVSGRSHMTVRRGVIDLAEWGFFRSGGVLDLEDMVIARQEQAAGATTGRAEGEDLWMRGTCTRDTPRAEVVRDAQLPSVLIDIPRLGCVTFPVCDEAKDGGP